MNPCVKYLPRPIFKSKTVVIPLLVGSALLAASLACSVDVPGGDFPPVTPTPSAPTPTPYIINAPAASFTPTVVKATSTPIPTAVQQPSPEATLAEVSLIGDQPAEAPTAGPDTGDTKPAQETTTAETGEPGMVLIPAGSFVMGYDQGLDDERPAHLLDLPVFEIDVYEVTNAQFADFVEETGFQTEAEGAGSSRNWRDEWAEGEENHPVVRVSWNDAVAYCNWLGKRLPTEAEWEKAARGPEGLLYPWGDTYDPARSNGKDSGLRTTQPVGSYAQGVSPFGVYDLAGNVREWTADTGFLPYPDNSIPSPYYGDDFRILRGGGWFDTADGLRSVRRNPTAPSAANWDVGFRCAK